MAEVIELDQVDALGAGALGEPGQRTFLIQARKDEVLLTVLVEKEQVALLAKEATQFLDRLAEEYPETTWDPDPGLAGAIVRDAVPLFRARLIGLGFDPERELVLLELREEAHSDEEGPPPQPEDDDGHVARIYATRAQIRAMASSGAVAVTSGRPTCPLCDQPMDPAGHVCPRWN